MEKTTVMIRQNKIHLINYRMQERKIITGYVKVKGKFHYLVTSTFDLG